MPRTTRTNLGACECCGGSSSSAGSSSSSSEQPDSSSSSSSKPYICATRAGCVGSAQYTWTRYEFGNEGWSLTNTCAGTESPAVCGPEPPPDRPGAYVGEVVVVGCILDDSTVVKECITREYFEAVPGWFFISGHDSSEKCFSVCNPPPPPPLCNEQYGYVSWRCLEGNWVVDEKSGCVGCSHADYTPAEPCTAENDGQFVTYYGCVDAAAAEENPLP